MAHSEKSLYIISSSVIVPQILVAVST